MSIYIHLYLLYLFIYLYLIGFDHWSYDCKKPAKEYVSQPSRSKILKQRLKKKNLSTMKDNVNVIQDDLEVRDGLADRILENNELQRRREKERKVEDGELSEVYNEKLDQQDILDADDELNRVYSRVV